MKVAKIESSLEKGAALDFLKKHSSRNLYLYEGIAAGSPSHWNLFFKISRDPLAVAHSKSGTYLHLFIADNSSASSVQRIARILFHKLPGIETLFGDKQCIEKFIAVACLKPTLMREYSFMELEKENYKTTKKRLHSTDYFKYGGVAPPLETAPLLLPLQIGYEIEEVRLSPSKVESSRLLALLKRHLARGDITAVFEGDKPLALASVNARFKDVCQIGSVYVVPAYRGKRYGYSVVLSHLERLFQRFRMIVLFVDIYNETALHLYKKIGFRPAGRLVQTSL